MKRRPYMPTPTPAARAAFLVEIYSKGLMWSGSLASALVHCNDDPSWVFVEHSPDFAQYVHFLGPDEVAQKADELILVNSAAQFVRYIKRPKA